MEGELSQKIKLKDKDTTKWKKFYYKLNETKLEKFCFSKKIFLGSVEMDKETKVVEFIDYDNTFGLFLKNKPPIILKSQYAEDTTKWIKIINKTLDEIEEEKKIEFKTNVETENPITPVTEYLKNSEKILYSLCSNYDSLR